MDPNLSFYIAVGALVLGGGYIVASPSRRWLLARVLRHPLGGHVGNRRDSAEQ